MGYDLQRFNSEIDEEYICSICSGVFEKPVQVNDCEHIFCISCILKWLKLNKTCPIDRNKITYENLSKVPKAFQNLVKCLKIACDYAPLGCTEIVKVKDLNNHRYICDHKQEDVFFCDMGCDTLLTINDHAAHNCLEEINIFAQNDNNDTTIMELENDLMSRKTNLRKLEHLFSRIEYKFKISKYKIMHELTNQQEGDFIQWVMHLPKAKIGHWASLLFTNKSNLINLSYDALMDANCPLWFIADFAKNSIQKNWPSKFNTILKRRLNQNLYENLIYRRIPGTEVAILFKYDNDVDDDMIKEPGIILHFACGVYDAH